MSDYITHFTNRLLNYSKKLDYIILGLIGGVPILLSTFVGTFHSENYLGTRYYGYLESYNWLAFVIIFPISLFLIRLFSYQIAGNESCPGSHEPPIVCLMEGYNTSAKLLINNFRTSLFKPKFLLIAFGISIGIHVLDMADILKTYSSLWIGLPNIYDPSDKDWAVFFLTGKISPITNFIFVLSAYAIQLMTVTLGVWLLLLLFNHNLLFLKCIYQKRFHSEDTLSDNIIINIYDPNCCFGFRPAFRAFNIQIIFLTIIGLVMLISRFANIEITQSKSIYAAINSLKLSDLFDGKADALNTLFEAFSIPALYPDIGQVILLISWLLLFFIISMPSLVKLRPFFGYKIEWLVESYMREFLPDTKLDWSNKENPTEEDINKTANQFAKNAFWPTGDNRAKVLFFFSFFVLFVIAFPLHFDKSQVMQFSCYYILILIFSSFTTKLFLIFLNFPLKYIDERLVNKP